MEHDRLVTYIHVIVTRHVLSTAQSSVLVEVDYPCRDVMHLFAVACAQRLLVVSDDDDDDEA